MYLVTGGGGFIGSHLVRALVRRGERVRVLDNGFSGSRARIADVARDVEWLDGDVRDRDAVARACAGIEVVLHHAAIASVPRSIAEPALAHEVNVTGTLNVLMAARAAHTRRVVFASSSAIYGDQPETPKDESLAARPVSPYGAQKLAGEAYCPVWYTIYGLETVALRYFNVFGPAQDPRSAYAAVMPRFIAAALAGESPTIYGDGEQSRDFIYVGNVADINMLAATVPQAAGAILNVGAGVPVTINQLVTELGHILGRPIHPTYAAARPGDIRESVANVARLRATLGYAPSVSFAAGLAMTVQAATERGSAEHVAQPSDERTIR